MESKPLIIGVIGGANVNDEIYDQAVQVGKLIAESGATLICGGLSGVMEGACKGVFEAGGMTIGIIPGMQRDDANPYVRLPIVTGMAQARNFIIVRTAYALVAIDGSYGTLSEIGGGMNVGTPIVSLGSWDVPNAGEVSTELFFKADSPEAAVAKALELARGRV